jgi:hypothetical protein
MRKLGLAPCCIFPEVTLPHMSDAALVTRLTYARVNHGIRQFAAVSLRCFAVYL